MYEIQISLDNSEKSYIDKSLHNMLLSIHLSSSGQYIWNNTTTSVRYNIFKSFLVRWPSFKGLCQWQSTKILVIYHKTTFCLVPLRPFAWTNTHFPLVGTTLIGYRLDDNFLTVFCMESRNKRYSETKIQQQRHSTIQPWLNLMETHYNKKKSNSTFHVSYLRRSPCFWESLHIVSKYFWFECIKHFYYFIPKT